MTEPKPGKSPVVVAPMIRFTPAEAERNKKAHDARRKSIRDQNIRSKSMK